ncbi:uncharacterized protein LOC144356284 [Saccoglossus kowalevskii]
MHTAALFYFIVGWLVVYGRPRNSVLVTTCNSCNGVTSNDECLETEICSSNKPYCLSSLRLEDGELRIYKGCKQAQACRNSELHNPAECSIDAIATKCSFCCDQEDQDDRLDCIQSDRATNITIIGL